MSEKCDGYGISKDGKLMPGIMLQTKESAELWLSQYVTHTSALLNRYKLVKVKLVEISDE